MNPDISYIARIPKDQKEMAIDQLKHFCVNTDDYSFNADLISDDCMVTFVINDEVSTRWFKEQYDFSNVIADKTLIGNIQLWIKEIEAFCDFEFWAVSSAVGKACLESKELKKALISFIKQVGGGSLILDYGDGNVETIFEDP